MHEASLVQGLLDLVGATLKNQAQSRNKKLKVEEIICEAGLLACFEPETLQACMEIFAEGTACENAKLKIETQPLACKCQNCQQNFNLMKRSFICPFCKSSDITFTGGNGLVLKELKVEEVNNG